MKLCVALLMGASFVLSATAFDRVPLHQLLNTVLANTRATCNQQPLLSCSQAFFNRFGFNAMPYNATTFDTTLLTYVLNNGIGAWSNVKIWEGQLVQCVGGQDNWNACLTPDNIQQAFGVSIEEAYHWTIRFLQLAYEVGPGYNVLTTNWYCIKQVDEHLQPIVDQCLAIYNNATATHPDQRCQNLNDLLVCFERPYAQSCGPAVGTLVCNVEKIAYHVSAPDCESHLALQCR